ncbi:hypothetical protein [Deinococcus sp. QL22]|nr:hypothetical protein [Deinococcus sp. QL22]UQN10787.1 hypothetical protein M1R55_31145 [Deinococcus sp. QL22]
MVLIVMRKVVRTPEFQQALSTQSAQLERLQQDLDAFFPEGKRARTAPPCEVVQAALSEVAQVVWISRLTASLDPVLLKVAFKLSARLLVLLELLPVPLRGDEVLSYAQVDAVQACHRYDQLGTLNQLAQASENLH